MVKVLTPQQRALRLARDMGGLLGNFGGQSFGLIKTYGDARRYLHNQRLASRTGGRHKMAPEDMRDCDVQAIQHYVQWWTRHKGPLTNVDLRWIFVFYAFVGISLGLHTLSYIRSQNDKVLPSTSAEFEERRNLPGDYEEELQKYELKVLPKR